jgi:hypothetical protein
LKKVKALNEISKSVIMKILFVMFMLLILSINIFSEIQGCVTCKKNRCLLGYKEVKRGRRVYCFKEADLPIWGRSQISIRKYSIKWPVSPLIQHNSSKSLEKKFVDGNQASAASKNIITISLISASRVRFPANQCQIKVFSP